MNIGFLFFVTEVMKTIESVIKCLITPRMIELYISFDITI